MLPLAQVELVLAGGLLQLAVLARRWSRSFRRGLPAPTRAALAAAGSDLVSAWVYSCMRSAASGTLSYRRRNQASRRYSSAASVSEPPLTRTRHTAVRPAITSIGNRTFAWANTPRQDG